MLLNQLALVRLVASLSLACASLFFSHVSQAEPDALDRPALVNARATGAVLLAVARAGDRLVAVGERGIIVVSDDNGFSWRQAKVPVSVTITNLNFPSPRAGWAVGHSGVVLHTMDGGETWSKQLDGKRAAELLLSAAKALGNPAGRHPQRATADAERFVADGPDKPFLDVYFYDDQTGIIVGAYGLFFTTGDGGKTWVPAMERLENPKGRHLYSIAARNNELFIAGEQGALYRSVDRGKSFTEIKTPYAGSYFFIIPTQFNSALVFGLRGNVYRSDDDYKVWTKTEIGTGSTLTSGVRLDDKSIVITDDTGNMFLSRDEGLSFKRIPKNRLPSLTDIVQAKDGALVLTGVRGITHSNISEIRN